ncbi:MAG: hypothetical protein QM504_05575 [Pseudomonadota bacterium]
MKLLIPISYFFSTPRSELWQIDTETKQQRLIVVLPSSGLNVVGKGLTSIAWLNSNVLVGCDFNRVFMLDRNLCEITAVIQNEQYNDLHQVSVKEDKIYLANTGRDCIDILDHQLKPLSRLDFLSKENASARINGNYSTEGDYYDNESSTIEFNLRKVPDIWHINHVIKAEEQLGNRVIATSFKKKYLLDAMTQQPLSNELPDQPHDGFVGHKFIWVTTVSGKIYRSTLSLPLYFELFLDLFKQSEFEGWCRGLLISGDALYIGITAIHEESSRTNWLKCPTEETRTGIYHINLVTKSIQNFYDFSHPSGSRVFSIIDDH